MSVAVLTQHNDNARTGANLAETVLNPSNVKAATFGRVGHAEVDGQVYAQPLYVPGVSFPDPGVRAAVYVATMNNSVYAFDADTLSPLWKTAFGNAVPAQGNPDIAGGVYHDIQGQIGIVATPVASPDHGALYVVTFSRVDGQCRHELHALDLSSGAEKAGSPRRIEASVAGTGAGSAGGMVRFQSHLQNQRPALLLTNGRIYIAFASYGDYGDYHGWVLGYDAATLAPLPRAANLTPNAIAGGIWQAGQGPAADAQGNVYVLSGNGNCNARSLEAKNTLAETAIGSPALAAMDDTRIAIAWTGKEALQRLNVAYADDGLNFTRKVTLGDTSLDGPALAFGNGRLWLGWTAFHDPARRVNVMSTNDLRNFGGKVVLGESSPFGPALAFGNGRIYLAWVGADPQQRLNVMSSADGQVWEHKVTLDEQGRAAPALHFAGGKLYLAWVGTDAGHSLNVVESVDGIAFANKVTLAHSSRSGPAFVAHDGLRLAWAGLDRGALMTASGAATNALRDVDTYSDEPWADRSAAGPALAVLRGQLYIAWTGNEDLRRLNVAKVSAVPSLGDCFVKLDRDLRIVDWFSPWNTHELNALDNDLGSGGILLVPGTNLMIGGGKEGKLYVIDRAALGRLCSECNAGTGERRIVDAFQATAARGDPHAPEPAAEARGFHHIHGSPVFWNSARRGPVAYVWGEADWLRAFRFDGHRFDHKPIDMSAPAVHTPNRSMPGAMLSLSANGSEGGILWTVHPTRDDANQGAVAGTLSAFDADNLENRLWHSDEVPDDKLGLLAKFTPPTVANGRVYMATFSRELVVYGLR